MAHTTKQRNRAISALRKKGSRGIPWYEQETYAADKGNHRKAVLARQEATHARILERKKNQAKDAHVAAKRLRNQQRMIARAAMRATRNARYQERVKRIFNRAGNA